MVYLSVIVATLCIQIPNVWAIKRFSDSPTLPTAFFIALLCLPATFLATAFFAFFYGRGYETLSYPAMAVMAYGASLLTSFSVQIFILRSKSLSVSEMVGSALIVLGLAVIISFKK